MKSSPISRNVSTRLNKLLINGRIIPLDLSSLQEFIYSAESILFDDFSRLIIRSIEKNCLILNLPEGQLEKIEKLATKKGLNKQTLCSNAIMGVIASLDNE